MKHEYLRELFSEENMIFPYNEHDYHDFDDRDTFNMDYALIAWLYECLRYFQDMASKVIDLDYKERLFNVDGKELTHRQCIDRMVEDCKCILLDDTGYDFETINAYKDDLFKVLSQCFWAMWW